VPWIEVFAAFVVSHLAGDYLLQTEHQALHKRGGLGDDPVKRRALASHAISYLACFIPVLVWLADELSAGALAATAVAIVLPHAIQDDGRVIRVWMQRVKRTEYKPGTLAMAVDQTFHIVSLFLLAVVVGT
jgi:hypothetical protein